MIDGAVACHCTATLMSLLIADHLADVWTAITCFRGTPYEGSLADANVCDSSKNLKSQY